MPKCPLPTLAMAMLCAAAALPAAAQLVLRQASNSPPGTVYHRQWQDFKAALERDSQGAVQVQLSLSEPNEANLLSNLRRGRVDCAGVSLQGAATVLPEIAVLQLPYLFQTLAQVDHVYGQPPLTDTFRKLFAARGIHMLGWVEVGFVNLYGVQPIRGPGDVAGAKLRATQSRASQAWIKAIGAEAVVLPIADALPGLQTGLIRGGESGGIVYEAIFAKAAPYYTLTQHAFDSGVVLCNKDWWDKLTPAQARQIDGSWDAPALVRGVRAQYQKLLDEGSRKGITVHKPSAAEVAQWRAAGEKSAVAVMASLPPDAATLRKEIERWVQAAPR